MAVTDQDKLTPQIAGESTSGGPKRLNVDDNGKILIASLDITLSALRDAIKEYLSKVTEVSIDAGEATGGSGTTIADTTKDWEVNKWANSIVEVIISDVHYYRTISSNTATILTITALGGAIVVAAGDEYAIRSSLKLADIDKWGGTDLTGRDISLDLKALTDDSIKGLLKSLGDVAATENLITRIGLTTAAIADAGGTGDLSAKLRRVTQGLEDLKTLIVLAAGTALIGKVGIDQTTPGTTDRVTANLDKVSGTAQTARDWSTDFSKLDIALSALRDAITAAAPNAKTLNDLNTAITALRTTSTLDTLETDTEAINTRLGEVQASPTANTVLARLKDLLTGIVLAAGTATIGKLAANTGVDIGDVDILSIAAGTNVIGKVDSNITKTIETELQAIVALAAGAQGVSSVLDLSGQEKQATIFIDHAKDHASASAGQGTEYVVQVSQKASGNDTWRTLASFTAAITAPTAMESDAEEAAGQTVIECGATVPAIGDILFFKHATIANSEWANVVARAIGAGTESVTLESGLTNIQAAGTYYTQGESFVVTIDVKSITRLRVVANNQKGSTNRAIVWRCAAITVE